MYAARHRTFAMGAIFSLRRLFVTFRQIHPFTFGTESWVELLDTEGLKGP